MEIFPISLIQHHKLVRDKIPSIIKKQGHIANIRALNDQDYFKELTRKLQEEVSEFTTEPSTEELADILEVVYALAEQFEGGKSALESVRFKKREQRGVFDYRIFLESVSDL